MPSCAGCRVCKLEDKIKAIEKAEAKARAEKLYEDYHRLRPDPMEPGYINSWKNKDNEERLAVVGSLIIQEGPFCGALVLEHIKNSRYRIQLPDGTEIVANRAFGIEPQPGLSVAGWYPVEG